MPETNTAVAHICWQDQRRLFGTLALFLFEGIFMTEDRLAVMEVGIALYLDQL